MDGYVLRVVSSDDHDKDADQTISEAVMSDLGLLFGRSAATSSKAS